MSTAITAPKQSKEPGAKPRRKKPSKVAAGSLSAMYPVAFMVIVFAVWWGVTSAGIAPAYILPSPADTWAAMTDNAAYLAQHTWVTTWETLIGFAIAIVVGIAVAVAMVYNKTMERTFYPIILFAQVVPKIAIAPLFIVWLGFGPQPKILVAVLMAFFPIVIAGISGLRAVDPEALELTSIMGSSRWKVFTKVRFPAALPELLGGLKVAATLAVTGAVVGEFVGANAGLGYVILQANGNIDTAMLFAALIIMSLMGVLLFMILDVVERLSIPWHASHRNKDA
ncbi:ABC transporter permease [Zhihengliuella sp.]|uniref:ABC transporter permease n=1 Tax=Zhihengliuella sp. TaxID=1954483 RepID=UPI0028118F5C|nr:ABC transporter permease [Zhihengliuella sp.]